VIGDVDLLRADVAGPELAPALKAAEVQVVCHLAAAIDVRASVADPVQDALRNVVGTVAVLQTACQAGVGKVVFASSGGSIYGSATPPPVPESAVVAPESPYAASKAAAELWLQTFERLHGLRWTALALANVYGPRQDPAGEAGDLAVRRGNAGRAPDDDLRRRQPDPGLRVRHGRRRRIPGGLRAPRRGTAAQHRHGTRDVGPAAAHGTGGPLWRSRRAPARTRTGRRAAPIGSGCLAGPGSC
jgi:nucleoside-diphosphate-sugar epimerase